MKKIAVLGMIVLLLLSIFTGCSSSDDSDPASMTFVYSLDPTKELTIYDNLWFMVKFIDPIPLYSVLNMSLNMGLTPAEVAALAPTYPVTISGVVTSQGGDTWVSPTITGVASNMTSNDPLVREQVQAITAVGIGITYTVVNAEITEVTLSFNNLGSPELNDVVTFSNILMGGLYLIKG